MHRCAAKRSPIYAVSALHAIHAIVTRPQPDADHWVAQLGQHGIAASALPLIDIGPATHPTDRERVADARTHWQRYGAIMLVSGNAARFFFDKNLALALNHRAAAAIKTRVWSPGPGTAKAALQQGITAALIDQPATNATQLDSESLWAQVAHQVPAMAQAGQRVLIVRGAEQAQPTAPGGTGREWLASQLRAAGVGVDYVAVYERCAPVWAPAFTVQASQYLHDGSIWLLSSSEAVMHLRNKLPIHAAKNTRALATHNRIATMALQAGFATVKQCRPTVADVVASLESFL